MNSMNGMGKLTLQVVVVCVLLSFLLGVVWTKSGEHPIDPALRARKEAELQQIHLDTSRQLATMTVAAGWTVLGLVATAVLAITLVAVKWTLKSIDTIYPDRSGLYPVLRERVGGFVLFHDPNRVVTSGVAYSREGRPAFLAPESVGEAQRQITSQAQVAQVLAAASSSGNKALPERALNSVVIPQMLSAPMPEVMVSPLEPSHVERLLLESGEIGDEPGR